MPDFAIRANRSVLLVTEFFWTTSATRQNERFKMNDLDRPKIEQLRVIDCQHDQIHETEFMRERCAFTVERNGHLFKAYPLFSVSEWADMMEMDRETITKILKEITPVPGPHGSKCYTFHVFMLEYGRYMREKGR